MHITLFDHQVNALMKIDGEQAEAMLAKILQESDVTLSEMGELAKQFFQSTRFNLASMVLAKWTEREPDNPEPWTNLGYALLKQDKVNQACALTEHALAINPNYFPALASLCDIYLQLGLFDQQLTRAQQCVAIQPYSCVAYNNLGTALWHNGKIAQAKQAFAESIRINPNYFEAKLNQGKIMSDEGDHLGATTEFESLLRNDRLDVHTREVIEFYLSFEYLHAGQRQRGWQLYERGFSASVPPLLARKPARIFNVPRWQGEQLDKNQKLLIWREQGIGDELRFLSLLQLISIHQSQWVIETDPRLVAILKRSFPLAEVRAEQLSSPDDSVMTDGYHIPVGSLPNILMSSSDLPSHLPGYLQASVWQIERFGKRFAGYEGNIKIGLCWRSHKTNAVRNKKYSALQDWKVLLRLPGVCFVSLQYGDAEEEIIAIENELGISILRWPDVNLKDDLEAVLGITHHLDYVVSTSTAVVPLAGAMGRPTIYLGHPSWILLGKSDSYPWHSSVKPVLVPPSEPVSSGIQSVVDLLKGASN